MPVPNESSDNQSRTIVWIGIGAGAVVGVVLSIAAAFDGVSQNAIPGGAMFGMFAAYFVLYVRWEINRPARRGRPIRISKRLRPVLLMTSGALGFLLVFLFDSYLVSMSIFWISSAMLFGGMIEAFYRVIRLR